MVAKPITASRSAQACSQRRQASSHIRQWSCMSACFSHSAAHSAHAMRHASNTAFTVARLLPVRRLRMWPGAVQISAQSRLRRMQLRSSVTISSPRQASPQSKRPSQWGRSSPPLTGCGSIKPVNHRWDSSNRPRSQHGYGVLSFAQPTTPAKGRDQWLVALAHWAQSAASCRLFRSRQPAPHYATYGPSPCADQPVDPWLPQLTPTVQKLLPSWSPAAQE